MVDLQHQIRDVPDWPEAGVVSKDITPLLAEPEGLAWAVDRLYEPFVGKPGDLVVGVESRGLGAGFVQVRKRGKLARATICRECALGYGTDAVELHSDAVRPGRRAIDDGVLATSGTMAATCELFAEAGADVVGIAVLIELTVLGGGERVSHGAHSLLRCPFGAALLMRHGPGSSGMNP